MQNKPASKVAAIVLAAGASRRMGHPKQLIPFGETTLLGNMAESALAAGCHPVVVVLGAYFEKIKPAVTHLPVTVLQNENWEKGMGNSIACGVDYLMKNSPEAGAALLMVCDQPLNGPKILSRLMETWQLGNLPIAASEYAGTIGTPALFDKSFFPALALLDGDIGAKPLLLRNLEQVARVPFPGGEVDWDLG